MKKFKKYIQIVISIALLVVLIKWINLEQFLSSLENANYLFIIIAVILLPIDRLLMTYKWNLLLKEINISIPLLKAFKIYYIANFIGLFLPPTIGGDIVRATYVVKQKSSTSDVIASILVDLLALFTFSIYSIIILITTVDNLYLSSAEILLTAVTIVVLSSLAFILTFNSKISNFINNWRF